MNPTQLVLQDKRETINDIHGSDVASWSTSSFEERLSPSQDGTIRYLKVIWKFCSSQPVFHHQANRPGFKLWARPWEPLPIEWSDWWWDCPCATQPKPMRCPANCCLLFSLPFKWPHSHAASMGHGISSGTNALESLRIFRRSLCGLED